MTINTEIKTWQERTIAMLKPGMGAQLTEKELSIIGTDGMLAEIAELRAALAAAQKVAADQAKALSTVNEVLSAACGVGTDNTLRELLWLAEGRIKAAVAQPVGAVVADDSGEWIRGPLRQKDRQDLMAYACTLGIKREDAEEVISKASTRGYVNGWHDCKDEPEPLQEDQIQKLMYALFAADFRATGTRDYDTDLAAVRKAVEESGFAAPASQPVKPADVGGVGDEGHLNDHHILRMAGGKLAFETQGGLIAFARKVIAESRAAFHRESPCVEENLKAVLGDRAVENMKNSRNISLTFEKAAKLMAAPACKYPDCTCHWAYGQGLVCNAEQRAALAAQTAAPVDLIREIVRDPCYAHLHWTTKDKCRALLSASKGGA